MWLLLMLAESVHGTLRQLLLTPVLGDGPARRISVFSGAALIFLIALLTIRWIGVTQRRSLFVMGAAWVALTVIFEIAVGRFVFAYDWGTIGADYDVSRGGLMPFGLAFMAITPLMAARLRRI